MKATILLAGLLALASEARSSAVYVEGFGHDQCAQYTVAYKAYGMDGAAPYLSWLQGYSTRLSEDYSDAGVVMDPLRQMPLETVAELLAKWCDANPTKPFWLASRAIAVAPPRK